VERVTVEKLTGFQLTKKFVPCVEPELSLLYIILIIEIEILKSLKSGKTELKDNYLISEIYIF